jgi:hypothetical protein
MFPASSYLAPYTPNTLVNPFVPSLICRIFPSVVLLHMHVSLILFSLQDNEVGIVRKIQLNLKCIYANVHVLIKKYFNMSPFDLHPKKRWKIEDLIRKEMGFERLEKIFNNVIKVTHRF